ncbi:uncharacterized protein LOC141695813 [Apium graveolens]|uniref:uncharacterized protein LOC141695813 n=1 Tax=Apium graveolens TaxID=4045 RepID=UPI003D7B479F
MDKSWIFKDRDSLEYEIGVESFLIFAEENSKDHKNIPCPCGHCVNFRKYNVKVIRGHLYEKGFSLGYTDYIWHGETSSKSVRSSAGSTFLPKEQNAQSETVDVCEAAYNSDDHDSYDFNRFVADTEQPLYKGSEYQLLPVNAYEAKKTLSDLGLEYIKFHACPNNCILYRVINLNASECPKCRLSRWNVAKDGKLRINSPSKFMWYFPIISRFKRMFKSPDTAEQLIWHSKQRSNDGQMRHPVDSPSWRNIDYRWPSFASDPRNLRLALGADAVLMWTINDFPGYANLSSCVNKGYKSCPICGDDTVAKYLSHSKKMCYQGHRHYLADHHPYRRQKLAFNGEQELLRPRPPLSEYWKFHHVRHCLDVMHIEKNVCDNLMGTLLNMRHKSKDSEASHRDMLDMGVRADLAPQVGENKTYLPPSAFTLSKAEKRKILSSFLNMKLLYGHASNIKNSKVVDVSKLDKLQSDVRSELKENRAPVSEMIRWLAAKPSYFVLTYEGYLVDGVWYFTKDHDKSRVVQNSGVCLVAKTVQVCSARDLNPIESDMTLYGIYLEIWELDYHDFKAPLFLCKWASNDRGIKVDDLGFTLVDFSRQGQKKDKYVSVDQVKQVFYVDDPVDATWSIVLKSMTREYHDIYNEDDLGDTIMEHQPFRSNIPTCDVADDMEHRVRENVEGIWVIN